MNNFSNKLANVAKAANKFIYDTLHEKKKVVLLDITNEPDDSDALYELPIVTHVDKYGNFNEYAILSIEKGEHDLILHTKGKGEADDEREFSIHDIMETDILCQLADLIEETISK